MYLLSEIEKYTDGKIINGKPETEIKEYSLLKDNHKAGEFFIPIFFKLVEPFIAVINYIGTQHLNNLKTEENILKEKLHITDFIKNEKILFVNTDNKYLQKIEKTNQYDIRKYSSKEAYDIQEDDGKISFKAKIDRKETDFHLNLYGRHHISNIILAIKIGEIYHISYNNIVKAISEFKPVDGRLKVLKNKQRDITLIDDAYNFSIEAIKLGLETANKIKSKRKIAVIGEMIALGEKGVAMHKELMLELDTNIKDGDLIYMKAANMQHFNRIVKHVKEKYEVKE